MVNDLVAQVTADGFKNKIAIFSAQAMPKGDRSNSVDPIKAIQPLRYFFPFFSELVDRCQILRSTNDQHCRASWVVDIRGHFYALFGGAFAKFVEKGNHTANSVHLRKDTDLFRHRRVHPSDQLFLLVSPPISRW